MRFTTENLQSNVDRQSRFGRTDGFSFRHLRMTGHSPPPGLDREREGCVSSMGCITMDLDARIPLGYMGGGWTMGVRDLRSPPTVCGGGRQLVSGPIIISRTVGLCWCSPNSFFFFSHFVFIAYLTGSARMGPERAE
jgi:hypothetical protein